MHGFCILKFKILAITHLGVANEYAWPKLHIALPYSIMTKSMLSFQIFKILFHNIIWSPH